MRIRLAYTAILCLLSAHAVLAKSSFTWTGAGGDGRWSTPANWSPAGPPAPGSDLVFGAAGTGTKINDLAPGTSFGSILFSTCGHRIDGNALVVTGGMSNPQPCNADFGASVTLPGPQTLTGFPYRFYGPVEISGTVTTTGHLYFYGPLNGSGTLDTTTEPSIEVHGGGNFNGLIRIAMLALSSELPNAVVVTNRAERVNGRLGALSTISLFPGTEYSWVPSVGRLAVGNLTLRAPVTSGYLYNFTQIDILGSEHDRVAVTGGVTINGGAQLLLGAVDAPVAAGQKFVIIDNDGNDPVLGTFADKPEGALLTSGGTTFRLSYIGGDGNDVTLTVDRIAKSWTGGAGNGLWSSGANWSPAGAPTSGDAIVFAAGPATTSVNDLAALTLTELQIARKVTISGNPLTIQRVTATSAEGIIENDVTLPMPHQIPGITFRGRVQIQGSHFEALATRFEGPFDGNGTIRPWGNGAFLGGGNYSGSIGGESPTVFQGAMPNADVYIHNVVSGNATLGKLFFFTLSPGTPAAPVGRMTFALRHQFYGYAVDVTPTDSDRADVSGPMIIDGSWPLTVTVRSGAPAVGQTYVIVSNDGTDAITGTWKDVPEGAVIDASGFRMRVSYKGGDGNDVTLTVLATARVWTGLGQGGKFSDPQNWSPAGVPQNGESLHFPTIDFHTVKFLVNDLPPGTGFATISGVGHYSLNGNALTVTEGWSWRSNTFIYTPVRFQGNVTVEGNFIFQGPVEIAGNVAISGQTDYRFLGGLNGTGTLAGSDVRIEERGGGNFAGTITTRSFNLFGGNLPNANVVAENMSGVGTIGDVKTQLFSPWYWLAPNASLAVGDLELSAMSVLVRGTQASRVSVKKATLAGVFSIYLPDVLPQPGQTFVILDNDGNDPIKGKFSNRPDGSVWTEGGVTFRISYSGGDGNDLTLTVVPASTTTLAQSSATSRLGSRVTLTATIDAPQAPAGEVDFYIDTKLAGTAPVINGRATFQTHIGDLGDHELIATFRSSGNAANSTSPKLTHTVIRAHPQWQISSSYASGTALLTLVAGRADRVDHTPTGSIRIANPGTLAVGQLANGTLMLNLGQFASGTHALTIEYGGDAKYDVQQVPYSLVIPAPALDVRGAEVTAGDNAIIVARLSSPANVPITATWRTTDGSARAGNDYVAGSGTITFEPGETEKRIEIATLRGNATDVTTFSVTIDSAAAIIRTTTATITIVPFRSVVTHLGLAYSSHATLDLYVPDAVGNSVPLIVALDARDWSMPQQPNPIALRATSRGYAVAVVRFRTSVQAKFPAQLDDAAAAIAFLRDNAGTYRLDKDRIGIWGIGAGGHIAALLGTHGANVKAIAIWNAPTDLAATAASCGRFGAEVAMLLAGDAREADPAVYASEKDAPFLIMHGGADCSVPAAHAIRLDAALQSAKVQSSLHILSNIGGYDDPAWRDPGVLAIVDSFFDRMLRGTGRRRGVN